MSVRCDRAHVARHESRVADHRKRGVGEPGTELEVEAAEVRERGASERSERFAINGAQQSLALRTHVGLFVIREQRRTRRWSVAAEAYRGRGNAVGRGARHQTHEHGPAHEHVARASLVRAIIAHSTGGGAWGSTRRTTPPASRSARSASSREKSRCCITIAVRTLPPHERSSRAQRRARRPLPPSRCARRDRRALRSSRGGRPSDCRTSCRCGSSRR